MKSRLEVINRDIAFCFGTPNVEALFSHQISSNARGWTPAKLMLGRRVGQNATYQQTPSENHRPTLSEKDASSVTRPLRTKQSGEWWTFFNDANDNWFENRAFTDQRQWFYRNSVASGLDLPFWQFQCDAQLTKPCPINDHGKAERNWTQNQHTKLPFPDERCDDIVSGNH